MHPCTCTASVFCIILFHLFYYLRYFTLLFAPHGHILHQPITSPHVHHTIPRAGQQQRVVVAAHHLQIQHSVVVCCSKKQKATKRGEQNRSNTRSKMMRWQTCTLAHLHTTKHHHHSTKHPHHLLTRREHLRWCVRRGRAWIAWIGRRGRYRLAQRQF